MTRIGQQPGAAAGGARTTPSREPGRDASRRAPRAGINDTTPPRVATRGVDGTSAERICARAEISFPTFRKHFRDVEEAFLTVLDEAVADGAAQVDDAIEAAGDEWPARVAAALDAILGAIESDPTRARVLFVESLASGGPGLQRYEEAIRRCLPGILAGRSLCEEELPALLEGTLVSGVAWNIHRRVALGEAAGIRELRGPMLEGLLAPYLGEAEARRIAEPPGR
jgi:AcrR family transcriptional regulator